MLSDKHVNTEASIIYSYRGCLEEKKKEMQRQEQYRSMALRILQNENEYLVKTREELRNEGEMLTDIEQIFIFLRLTFLVPTGIRETLSDKD